MKEHITSAPTVPMAMTPNDGREGAPQSSERLPLSSPRLVETNRHSQRAMQQKFPFKRCDECGRKTSWVIFYGALNGYSEWKRKCPFCMTPSEFKQCSQLIVETQARGSRSRLVIRR